MYQETDSIRFQPSFIRTMLTSQNPNWIPLPTPYKMQGCSRISRQISAETFGLWRFPVKKPTNFR